MLDLFGVEEESVSLLSGAGSKYVNASAEVCQGSGVLFVALSWLWYPVGRWRRILLLFFVLLLLYRCFCCLVRTALSGNCEDR